MPSRAQHGAAGHLTTVAPAAEMRMVGSVNAASVAGGECLCPSAGTYGKRSDTALPVLGACGNAVPPSLPPLMMYSRGRANVWIVVVCVLLRRV